MTISKNNLEERIGNLNPKDFGDKYFLTSKKEKINLNRGIKKIINRFGRRTIRTEEETIEIVNKLALVKVNENPKDIIKALCSESIDYFGFFYNAFQLQELKNTKGEKVYRVRLYYDN